MLRDVILRATLNEMVGDESYELWLKIAAGAWALYGTGAVGEGPTQDFLITDLEDGVAHAVQLRGVREGRYRNDYTAVDPDLWPAQSLLEFTPGTAEYAAPTLNGTSWSRTSGASQRITVNATSSAGNEALALQLLRDGVVVDEVAGPHAGAVDLVDLDPPIAEEHEYTVRHRSGFLVGLASAPAVQWAGPDAPTGLAEVAPGAWYDYEIAWDAPPSGAVTRVQDTWEAAGIFAARAVTAADATTYDPGEGQLPKDSELAPNGNIAAYCEVRIRHELESFSVVDVSDWAAPVWVETQVASDETAWDPQSPP